MKIHEYQAKELFRKYGVPVPEGNVAFTPDDAASAAEQLGAYPVVVKAQIHAGGRGKGGGVKLAQSLAEAQSTAAEILGMTLVTPQTGPEGKLVRKLLVEEGLDIVRACRDRYDGRVRNPFSEIECGHFYARAMAAYGLLEGLTGARYDAYADDPWIEGLRRFVTELDQSGARLVGVCFGHQIVAHLDEGDGSGPRAHNPVDGDEVPVPHFGVLLEVDGGDGCIAATSETIASNEYPISRNLGIQFINACDFLSHTLLIVKVPIAWVGCWS